MNIAILETAADENPLDALTRAALNGMGKGSHDGTAISCFVITPASLRPYVEEHVLRALHELRSSDPESYAGMTLPVHSFASFAASVIGNADGGAYVRTPMGAFALQTFVRHCMHENPALFGGVPDTHGFVALVARQLSELVSDGIAAESLQADADASGSVRMASMATLMRLYAERYAQSSAVPNDPAAVIVPWAERHAQDCRWYLYGFDDMTGSQLRAVRAVMARGHVTVCVESGRRFVCLAPLADDGDGAVRLPSSGKAPTGQAWSAAFANVVDETRWVRDRVAEDIAEGVPPRDVLVCARDLSPYERLLPNIFGESSIAINGMAEATLADDAFAGTLLGLLDPALYAFETKAVIRVFRSGAFSLGNGGGGADAFGELRNYLATHDMDRETWMSDDPLPNCRSGVADALAGIRARICDIVIQAGVAFGPGAVECGLSVRLATESMVEFLKDHHVDRRMVSRSAERSTRVWGRVMALFDDLVAVAGDDPFAWHFQSLAQGIEEALASERVMPIVALNGVDVSTYAVPLRPYRRIYCLGSCRDSMPAVTQESELLGDIERNRLANGLAADDAIASYGLRASTVAGASRMERVWFDAMLAAASERIVFTYPRNRAGVDQHPSDYLDAVQTQSLPSEDLQTHPEGFAPVPAGDGSIDSRRATALFTETIDGTFTMLASVSALETFFANPMEYFAKYGLRLDPLQPAQLDAAVRGSYLHAVLERTVRALIGLYGDSLHMPAGPSDSEPNSPSIETIRELIHRYADVNYCPDAARDAGDAHCPSTSLVQEDPRFALLDADDRMRMVRHDLERRALFAVEAYARIRAGLIGMLQWESANGMMLLADGDAHFRPIAAERVFGAKKGESAPALDDGVLHTPSGDVSLKVQGKVDRMDMLELHAGAGIVVIDYKSSGKTLFDGGDDAGLDGVDATESFYGRELQLMTYARAAESMDGRHGLPVVAMFFLPIAMPKYAAATSCDGVDGVSFLDTASRGLSMQAVKPDEPDLVQSGVLVLPLANGTSDNDGGVRYVSLTREQFEKVRDWARIKIREGCERLLAGKVGAHPSRTARGSIYRDGDQYSDYGDLTVLERLSDDYWDFQPAKTLKDILDAMGGSER